MAVEKPELRRLAGSAEYEQYILKARERFEHGRGATVEQIRRAYRAAARSVKQDLQHVAAGTLRHGHLTALSTNLSRRARELNAEVLAGIRHGLWVSVEAGSTQAAEASAKLLGTVFARSDIRRLFAGINEQAVAAFESRVGRDGLRLSDRIWRTGESWRNAVQKVLEDGVARGADPRQFARELEQYLQPGVHTAHKLEVRRNLGISADVSYEALRLARTELNNAYHEGAILANRAAPGYKGVYWRLSGSHPFADVCDDLASHNGDGFWPKGEEPVRPHPQCFCQAIPVYEDPEEFTDRLVQWVNDPQSQPDIERWYDGRARKCLDRPFRLAGPLQTAPVAGADLGETLERLESEIVGRSTERAYVLGPDGRVWLEKDGGRDYVLFTKSEASRFLGGVLTHNHPSGTSFSPEDVKMAVQYGLVQIRAATLREVHVMRPGPRGWPALEAVMDAARRTNDEVFEEFARLVFQGRMSREEAERIHMHEVWVRVAARLGLTYERRPRWGP